MLWLFDKKQQLATLKDKPHHPGAPMHPLHPILSCLCAQDRQIPVVVKQTAKTSLDISGSRTHLVAFFVCLLRTFCSAWRAECFTHSFSMEKKENICFEIYYLYVTQLAWEGTLVLVEHWHNYSGNQSQCSYFRSSEAYRNAIFSLLSSLNGMLLSHWLGGKKIFKGCSLTQWTW